MKIAINGFGRIGRAALKISLERKEAGEDINIVAINDLAPVESLAYLLKYDTVYGIYDKDVSFADGSLRVAEQDYRYLSIKEPKNLPWRDLGVDVVLECTGFFTKSEDAIEHINAGAKNVLLSAPAKDEGIETLVLGSGNLGVDNKLVSNASCTTNSVTPIVRILTKEFGIEKAMLTSVHAYTATQNIVDGPNRKDPRRGRAGAQNIVPSSTGAAKATAKAFPDVVGIFDGIALRVPVVCGSISDITAVLKRNVTVDEVNKVFKKAQDMDEFKGIVRYSEELLVSSDIIKTTESAIVDGQMTRVVGGNLVKVMAWYDNEWGYSNRLVDVALHIAAS